MRTLSIVIPSHNEALAIPQVLGALGRMRARLLESARFSAVQVIVVDDASSDDTQRILSSYDWVETLRQSTRVGYGSALKAGFAHSTGEWIAFLDLDATYDPEDLDSMTRVMEDSDVDFLLGERRTHGSGMPLLRLWGNGFFNWLIRQLYAYPVKDACTGCRMFRRKWLKEVMELPHSGLEYSLAMTLWSIKAGVSLRELPISYSTRSGSSKLQVVSDGGKFLWTILNENYGPIRG